MIKHSEVHPNFTLTSCSKINIDIDERLQNDTKTLIEALDIKHPYICIHNRDPKYLIKKGLSDSNNHDFRDFDFTQYNFAINQMKKKNLTR